MNKLGLAMMAAHAPSNSRLKAVLKGKEIR